MPNYLFVQLDSLYYSPDINLNAGARDGVPTLLHGLLWIPQLIWALLAAWQLVRRVERWKQGKTPWFSVLVPYVMVLLVIAFFWQLHGVRLGSIYQYQQPLNRAMFEDSALPSLWAIPGLLLVHLIKYAQMMEDRQR